MRSFVKSLSEGQSAERRWVDDLRLLGRSVAHGKKLVIRRHDKNKDHVETPDALALVSVEIKQRTLEFTCPADYPFDTVFVDDCRGYGQEAFHNLIYVYVSKPTGQWVWLTVLDRDDSWEGKVTFDAGRGHDVPVLIAPKRFLRPSWQLTDLIFPHAYLDLVDGDTRCFRTGGGEVEERERYLAKTHSDFAGRAGAPPQEAGKHMG